jgi:aspartyl-tRNA(Asn)/glutamyl-tRNA(Gln) amidotransferase subunit A
MNPVSQDLVYMSAAQQSAAIKKREISPVDLVRASLDRIERYDGKLRAWISVDAERAMRLAKQAEDEIVRGHYRGPMHGLPYGVKDQMHAVGFKTSLGTRVLDESEMVAPYDATLVKRLSEAGAILLGKQNLHEWGKGGTIDFPYGQPRNPWNPAHDASSSSTGSGIAPAAGMCSFSIGEDTGGSVRGPASCNGVVGLRPTFGRVSRHGGVMAGYTSDTFGPLARTVTDIALVMQAISGHDPADVLSSPRPVPDFTREFSTDLKGMKLGVVREIAYSEWTHPEVLAAFEASLDVLRQLGAVIEEISLPLVKWAVPLQMLTTDADVASWFLANYLRDRYDRFDEGTRSRLVTSCLIPAATYSRAMRARTVVRAQVLEAMRKYDALLTPTNLTPPRLIEEAQENVSDSGDVLPKLIKRRIAHYPFSLSNVPALSVPCGFSKAGLPLALQIASRPFGEPTAFKVAQAYEQASVWHKRHPDLEKTLS